MTELLVLSLAVATLGVGYYRHHLLVKRLEQIESDIETILDRLNRL